MKILFTTLIISLTFYSQSQQTISINQREKIKSNCTIFLEQRSNGLRNENYNSNTLKSVTTDTLFLLLEMDQEYVNLLEYNISNRTDTVSEIILNDTTLGCKVDGENGTYILDVIESNGNWKIGGYNGKKVEKQHYLDMQHHLDSARVIGEEYRQIKSVVKSFVSGLNELKSEGQSSSLEKVTTPLAYQYFVLKQELDELNQYPNKKNLTIREIQYIQMDTLDKAVCRIYISEQGGVKINLVRKNEEWLVAGLRDNIVDNSSILEVQNDINYHTQKSQIAKDTELFNNELKAFLLNKKEHQLNKYTTKTCFEYLKLFKLKCGDYKPELLSVNGFSISKDFGKFSFEADTAKYKSHNLELQFVKTNKTWQVASIANSPRRESADWHLDQNFRKIVTYLNVRYPVYENSEELEDIVFDVPHINSETNTKSDTNIRVPLERLNSYAQFPGGYDKQVDFMKSQQSTDTFLISFIVEKNGDITHLKTINTPVSPATFNKINAKIQQMPNWEPAIEYRSLVRSQVIVSISI
jgi:hypothetical protein